MEGASQHHREEYRHKMKGRLSQDEKLLSARKTLGLGGLVLLLSQSPSKGNVDPRSCAAEKRHENGPDHLPECRCQRRSTASRSWGR